MACASNVEEVDRMSERACAYCGGSMEGRRPDARYCSNRCSKAKPCRRCGGPKEPGAYLYCTACSEVTQSVEYKRAIDRESHARRREEAIANGTYIRRQKAPEGQRWCARCQRFLPLTSFTTAAYCIPCNRDYNHERHLDRTFGITAQDYRDLMELQGGRCAICLTRPRSRRLAVDHNHKTGEIRGLLCSRCNRGILGRARDSEELLLRAVAYLRKPPARTRKPVSDHRDTQADWEMLESMEYVKPGEIITHANGELIGMSLETYLENVSAPF